MRAESLASRATLGAGGHGSGIEVAERGLESTATTVMQAVDRALRLAQSLGDFAGREAGYVAQDQNLALLRGQSPEGLAQ